MDNSERILVKLDANTDGSIEIATYYESLGSGMKYCTLKNGKEIGWAINLQYALGNHYLFVHHQIRKIFDEAEFSQIPKYFSPNKGPFV